MYLNIVYVHMLYCMIKLRPDLESTHFKLVVLIYGLSRSDK